MESPSPSAGDFSRSRSELAGFGASIFRRLLEAQGSKQPYPCLYFAHRTRHFCSNKSLMVLLAVTAASKAAIDAYLSLCLSSAIDTDSAELKLRRERLEEADTGSPIEHSDLVDISKSLKTNHRRLGSRDAPLPKEWRLESLLRGAAVYQKPPPPKPEPVSPSLPSHSSFD